MTRLPASRWIAAVSLTIAAGGYTSAHAQAATAYTITKIVDSNTAMPGSPGHTFTLGEYDTGPGFTNNAPVIHGETVVFVDEDGGNGGADALWRIRATGTAPPVRLVDSTTTAQGNSGPFFMPDGTQNVGADGISSGILLFAGRSPEGIGYYSIPLAGGAVTTLVNSTRRQPNVANGVSFQFLGALALAHGRVFFGVYPNSAGDGEGIYGIPLSGGSYTIFGDKSTPITGDPNGNFHVGGRQPLAANGNTVAFTPSLPNSMFYGNTAVYTAPASGLTVDSTTGFVNNATRIAYAGTVVPGDPKGRPFNAGIFDVNIDDSGAVVFAGFPVKTGKLVTGLYSSINGVLRRLVDKTTSLPGDTGHILDVYAPFFDVVGGQVVFNAGYQRADGTQITGIYLVPVGGGPMRKVAEGGDILSDGSSLGGTGIGRAGLSNNGKVAFHAPYYPPGSQNVAMNGIFVAIPRGADLIGYWDGAVTEKITASGKVRLKCRLTVLNQSVREATANGAVVRFYLSTSSTLDGSQQVIGRDAIFGALAPGASVDLSLAGARFDNAAQLRGKYLVATIDPEGQIMEADKTNNQASFGPLP